MKKTICLLTALIIAFSCVPAYMGPLIETAEAAITTRPIVHPRSSLMVNIQTSDIDRVMMAVRLANTMLDHDKKVTIYLNIEGVQNAWAGQPQNVHAITGKTIAQAMTELVARGATVAACQMCMSRYGITPAELLPGVIMSSPDFAYYGYMDMYTQVVTY